ncbi:putative lipoprotein [Finegoldia magna SY403409CC001050417]|uniref:Lipoprotein n=2 Tax=Finegoldia magna TaxID=1260 RepID=A0A7D4FIP2_FINMA|nr:hypothetical protein [Finegoldia magna]EGS33265.1 putative lipoprotein [Finegoldia magna SY403409CC001050417]QKH79138.1 hypothetical protein FOC70_01630 [Finegoldia magna]QKH80548.1 hypothetical protein FOC70_09400 [Finegoldia magna]
MKTKKILSLALALLLVVGFAGCAKKDNVESDTKKEDKIEIFDSNDIKIAETEKPEELDYFSDFIEMCVENANDKKFDNYFKEIPDDAIKSYHLILTSKDKDNEATKIDFYIYENYPYITIEGMPMITTPFTWQIPKEDLKEFNDKVEELKDMDNKR